jgi:hypothetical protein
LRRHAANHCRSDLHPPIHEREQHRDVSIKENHMSSIPNLTSASSALPPLNFHTHGHKKGSHVGSTNDSGSNPAGQVPVATVQNLFGTLLQSLEQVIGVQLSAPKPAATAATATAQNLQANGTQTANAAGSNVSVKA